MDRSLQVDLDAPECLHNPARYFAEARERGDLQWSDRQRGWVALSHREVEAGFRDDERLSSDRAPSFQRAVAGRSAAFQQVAELLSGWMNFRDPPMHTRLREPVRAAFTPRAVSSLETEIQSIVDGVLDSFEGESADLSHDFARPIPALVIGAILGVPPEDRHLFHSWSHDLGQMVFSVSPGSAPEESVGRATTEFSGFFSRLIEREREQPSGTILSALVAQQSDLSAMELIGACTLLLFGGHETTTTLLVNALGLLLERPDTLSWLRDHPEADATAVEGVPPRAGPGAGAAAQDHGHARTRRPDAGGGPEHLPLRRLSEPRRRRFRTPGELNLERTPNPQLGFGWGLHYCLGASVARMEASIALRTLLNRYPHLESIGPVPPARASTMGYGRRPLKVAQLGTTRGKAKDPLGPPPAFNGVGQHPLHF